MRLILSGTIRKLILETKSSRKGFIKKEERAQFNKYY